MLLIYKSSFEIFTMTC